MATRTGGPSRFDFTPIISRFDFTPIISRTEIDLQGEMDQIRSGFMELRMTSCTTTPNTFLTHDTFLPKIRSLALLKSLVSPWRYLRYRIQEKIVIRGESGFVWTITPTGGLNIRCKKGHDHYLCQEETGDDDRITGADKMITILMHIRRGKVGEREIISNGDYGLRQKNLPTCLRIAKK